MFLVVFCLVRLGFWQLQRAEEKTKLLQQKSTQAVLTEQELSQGHDLTKFNGAKVNVYGKAKVSHVWLLDNQVHQGKVGYKVISEFTLTMSQKILLIDWGWVAAGPSRDELPNVTLPADDIQLKGLLKSSGFSQLVLKQTRESGWPRRIQSVNELNISNGVIYAETNSVLNLVQTYKTVVMPPEKHQAYALQWFLLAVASVFVFVAVIRRKGE